MSSLSVEKELKHAANFQLSLMKPFSRGSKRTFKFPRLFRGRTLLQLQYLYCGDYPRKIFCPLFWIILANFLTHKNNRDKGVLKLWKTIWSLFNERYCVLCKSVQLKLYYGVGVGYFQPLIRSQSKDVTTGANLESHMTQIHCAHPRWTTMRLKSWKLQWVSF